MEFPIGFGEVIKDSFDGLTSDEGFDQEFGFEAARGKIKGLFVRGGRM